MRAAKPRAGSATERTDFVKRLRSEICGLELRDRSHSQVRSLETNPPFFEFHYSERGGWAVRNQVPSTRDFSGAVQFNSLHKWTVKER